MADYRKIDVEHWEEKQHYAIFKEYENPRYEISFELDISNFLKRVKENQWSFTLTMIHSIATCANQIEAFRYRFEDGEPVIYDTLRLSFTHISHTDSGKKQYAVPMFDWAKYYTKENHVILPFSVEVHHSFVDGIHIGWLAENLQEYLNQF